jgi:predicted TIM-barrel fold metal-dependent hydrolase
MAAEAYFHKSIISVNAYLCQLKQNKKRVNRSLQFFAFFFYNLPMIIDCHTHIFSPDVIEHRFDYASRDTCFAELYGNPKAKMVTAEKLIEEMDKAGVDKSVVLNIGWRSIDLCYVTNDYIMEAAAKYPARLVPFCSVPQLCAPESIAEVERCVKGGIKGIGELRPDIEVDLIDEYGIAYIGEFLKTNKLTLLVHATEPVGHDYPGKDLVTPAVLETFIGQLPGVNIICAHWGGGLPFYTLMPEVKKAFARVYYDSAASPFLYTPAVYGAVAGLAGKDRILFGSDYPLISQKRQLDEINAIDMNAADKELLLGGNVAKLLGIKAGKK